MRPTQLLLKATGGNGSSKQWLARQARDPFVKARAQRPGGGELQAYRSRAAFKLLQMTAAHRLFSAPKPAVVVDLGAAPGGWSQVIAHELRKSHKKRPGRGESTQAEEHTVSAHRESILADRTIIAVDILPMAPMSGVHIVRQDFLDPRADELIANLLPMEKSDNGEAARTKRKVDLITSDIAKNVSGNRSRDIQSCLDVCSAVLQFAVKHLRVKEDGVPGGNLVLKYFADSELELFRKASLDPLFSSVHNVKPEASRSESSENYFVCKGFKGFPSLPAVDGG